MTCVRGSEETQVQMHTIAGSDYHAFPVLLLAAGASRRMGRPKALLKFNDGTLMDHAVSQAKQLGANVTVVSGSGYPLVRYRCRNQPSAWCYTPDWVFGMAASLKSGLQTMGPRAKGVFVTLLDQPLVSESDLRSLAFCARQEVSEPFAADIYGNPGAPAYIPRRLWKEIMMLEGDRGAARILTRHQARTLAIKGVESDVDTPEDWKRIRYD